MGAYSLRKLFCSREVNETLGRQNQNLALTSYTESETLSALISISRQSAPPTHTPYLCTAFCGTKAKANDQVDLLSPLRSTIDGSPEQARQNWHSCASSTFLATSAAIQVSSCWYPCFILLPRLTPSEAYLKDIFSRFKPLK